ncbi:hypothetical protein V8E51_003030 [Hyaloscypha variabilis]
MTAVDTMASATEGGTAAPSALMKFTLFPKLPTEIRLKIFRHALPSTTMVQVTKKVRADDDAGRVNLPKTNSWFIFRLLEHRHNSYVSDVSLLSASTESRGIYLKHFNGSLKTAKGGLIRFSKEDIVYIRNLNETIRNQEIMRILFHGNGSQILECHNLALPSDVLYLMWNTMHEMQQVNWDTFMCFLALCKTAAVVGPVWNDSEIVIGEGGGYSDETIGAAGWLREIPAVV